MEEVKDKFGAILEIGDAVIFADGGRNASLKTGVLVDIEETNYGTPWCVVKNDATGKNNRRGSSYLMRFQPYKDAHPELFI